jgi:photosystem II stability/assembly factor-like uncharacterized protein
VDAQTGFVGGAGVILATRDGGMTWEQRYAGPAHVTSLAFLSPDVGWAVAEDTLLGTVDGGLTWSVLGEPDAPLTEIAFTSATTGFGVAERDTPAGDQSGHLVRTNDGGSTWSAASLAATVQSVCFGDAGRGWAAGGDTVWGTADGGESWSIAFRVPDDDPRPSSAAIQCRGAGAWLLYHGFGAAASHVPHMAFRSGDGLSWEVVFVEPYTASSYWQRVAAESPGTYPGPFAAVDASTAYFIGVTPPAPPDHSATLVRATPGGLEPLGNIAGGLPFGSAFTGYPGRQPFAFADREHGWLVTGSRGQILATADGGVTWVVQYQPAKAGE